MLYFLMILYRKGQHPEWAIHEGACPSRIGTLSLLYIYKKWSKPSINTINHSIQFYSNTLSALRFCPERGHRTGVSPRRTTELDDFNGISPETRELAESSYANGSHTPSLINLEASCLDWAPVLAIGEEEHASILTVAVHPDGNPKAIFCIMNREGRLQNDA